MKLKIRDKSRGAHYEAYVVFVQTEKENGIDCVFFRLLQSNKIIWHFQQRNNDSLFAYYVFSDKEVVRIEFDKESLELETK